MTPSTKVAPHPEVLFTALQNGEAVLLQLETKAQFTLNETGTRIWQLLGLELGEVARQLAAEFDVDVPRAQESVFRLVAALAEARLVRLAEA